MIKDSKASHEIQASWKGVLTLKTKTSAAINGSIGLGGAFAIFIADAAHNLPFLHACAVLNDTLLQLRKEGHFKCSTFFLGALLEASEKHLPWKNYSLISEIVSKRNDVAHRGQLLPRRVCWRFIEAIEDELVSWRIVTA